MFSKNSGSLPKWAERWRHIVSLKKAKNDLRKIAAYTLRVWGKQQTVVYITDLRSYCNEIAHPPRLTGAVTI